MEFVGIIVICMYVSFFVYSTNGYTLVDIRNRNIARQVEDYARLKEMVHESPTSSSQQRVNTKVYLCRYIFTSCRKLLLSKA